MTFAVSHWLPNLLIFLAASWILVKGSDVFVDAASAIARHWNVSELVIGLTLVSIGTSLPELSTSLYAQWNGDSDFVIGNIFGSNVTNVTLILGAAAFLGKEVLFDEKLLKRDNVLMVVLTLAAMGMFFLTRVPGRTPGETVPGLNRIEGFLLLAAGAAYCWVLMKTPSGGSPAEGKPANAGSRISLLKEFGLLALGLVMIVGGSKGMVDTVSWTAEALGIPTIVISATIVAFGTSVPELAVTIAGIVKNRNDMAVGNIIGSCIFNIFLIIGLCAAVRPLGIHSGMTGMVNMSLFLPVCAVLSLFMYTGKKLVRWEGAALLCMYLAFLGYNARNVFQ